VTTFPDAPDEMRKVSFNGQSITGLIAGCYTVDVITPGVIPKQVNRVEVPGRDFAWDFGNHDKQDFTVTAEFIILSSEASGLGSMQDKLSTLFSILDTEEAKKLEIDGESDYYGQVFEPPDISRSGQATRVSVTWVCREPTDQDIG